MTDININKTNGLKLLFISITILAALLLIALPSATKSFAAEKKPDEGKRGKLNIDYKSKIDFIKEGRKYLAKADVKQALYYATYAVSYGCDAYDSYLLLADIYKASKDAKSEIGALEYAVTNAPNQRLKAETLKRLLETKKISAAAEIQRAAKAVETGQSPNKILRLASTFERYSKPEEAMAQYEYLDDLSPKARSAKHAKIKLYLKQSKRDLAKSEIKKYFSLKADDTSMVYLLAYNGFNISEIKDLGYNGEGKFELRKYNRTYAGYYYEIGHDQYLAHNYISAKNSLLYSLEYFKTDPDTHNYLGKIFYTNGMFKEASFHFGVAYEFLHEDYEVGLLLAKSQTMSKQYEKARLTLKRLLKSSPNTDEYAYWLLKTGISKNRLEDFGYVDLKSPFYKKPRTRKKETSEPAEPGPENLLRTPPTGLNTPFYDQAPQIQLY